MLFFLHAKILRVLHFGGHLCMWFLLQLIMISNFLLLSTSEGGILEQAPVGDPGWEAYRKSLEKSGYFRDLLEGSKEQKQLLQAAIADYRRTRSFAATRYHSLFFSQ